MTRRIGNGVDPIRFFAGKYRFLSNFYPAPVIYSGKIYPTVENAYQAAKCASDDNRTLFELWTPAKAKRMGQSVFIRDDWEDVKISIMRRLVYCKFSYHTDLTQQLLDTGHAELIEGNTWGDKFWGVCSGVGENHLGKILMHVRRRLRSMP